MVLITIKIKEILIFKKIANLKIKQQAVQCNLQYNRKYYFRKVKILLAQKNDYIQNKKELKDKNTSKTSAVKFKK